MKAKYLLPFFILFSSALFAQNLTLTELFSMCNKPNWNDLLKT